MLTFLYNFQPDFLRLHLGMCSNLKAIYGRHQAPVKFKQEVVAWFKANSYTAANTAETIWIQREGTSVLTHGVYTIFLHHTNDAAMYK